MKNLNSKKQNHTSHIALPTSQKGITLIALIITIIVMLILAGVTIDVALDGGLFSKAEEATELTTKAAEKEELLMAVVAAIGTDGKVSFSYLDKNLPTDWTGSNGTYTSPKGRTYTVNEKGKITEGTGSGNTPVAFTWSSVNLGNVDTSTAYKGYIGAPANMTVIVSFTEDGKVILSIMGETGEGTYAIEGEEVSITIDGYTQKATVEDNKITIAAEGASVVFQKQ
jgi:type II secretory pathway pseudopilin PulG